MTSYLGIDLGTTYSAIATIDDTGRPKMLLNNGRSITPSCVMIENDQLVVGDRPEKMLGWEGAEVGARFKRNMGEDTKIKLGTREFTPSELSAAVLATLKKAAEASVGEIAEAVVTIPANFMQEAREATMLAAQKAGLKIKYIINEPTAAALYYGFKEGENLNGNCIVYDLGGGTFDVSVVRISGQEIEVIATEGVSKLGGDDFDRALIQLVKAKYEAVSGRELADEEIPLSKAVKLKHDLSQKELVRYMADDELIEVTRAEFEEAISSLISQTELLCETVLEEADITVSEVNKVLLAGGSTRMPCVSSSIERVFGQKPIATANVDEVVALGAALYAAVKSDGTHLSAAQSNSVQKLKVSEISTYYFGTIAYSYNSARDTQELQNSVIIHKGEKLPCSRTKSFFTMAEGQTGLDCKVTKSGSPETDPRFVSIVWQGDLELPTGRPSNQQVDITYAFDENGMMKCSFVDVESGRLNEIDLDQVSASPRTSEIDKFLVD